MLEDIKFPIRINRYLALKGYATRRAADELIKSGLVLINSKKAELGSKVSETDKVEVLEDSRSHNKKLVYLAYYKPRGIVTHSPQSGEKAIKDILDLPGIFPIGRLDKESEGLIILTNDGRITERVLNPRFEHEKEYEAVVREKIPSNAKKIMENGIMSENQKLTAKNVEILSPHKMTIILTEGKTHQIRRMLDDLRLTVEKLKRTRIMDIKIGPLSPGQYRELSGDNKTKFLSSLGLK